MFSKDQISHLKENINRHMCNRAADGAKKIDFYLAGLAEEAGMNTLNSMSVIEDIVLEFLDVEGFYAHTLPNAYMIRVIL